jgi:hypothetical protein
MKHMNEILCAAVAIAMCLSYAIDYLGGRRGMFLSIGPLPLRAFTFLTILLCLISLFIMLVNACRKQHPAGKTLFLLAIACVIFSIGFLISPTKLFLAGFRQRIQSTVSPGELREIARVCHDELPADKPLPGPQKLSLWDESEHRSQWNRLIRSTSLGKLDPWMTVTNHSDNVVIAWGGALIGHWGLIIQTNGRLPVGDLAEGIQTFAGPN